MRTRNFLAVMITLVLPALLPGQAARPAKANTSAKTAASRLLVMPTDDVKWTDLAGAPSVKVADLWGTHEKGAFGALFKLPAGFAAPLHTHTHGINGPV